MGNIAERIVDEWFSRLKEGYAVEPYTPSEMRVLRNVIHENRDWIIQHLVTDL